MFVLDTDHITILQFQSQPAYGRIQARLMQYGTRAVFMSAVSLQEQMLGAHAIITGARTDAAIVQGYRLIASLHRLYSSFQVLPVEAQDVLQFHDLRKQGVRIGTMDLRIAAIALTRGLTVVTRNRRDFQQVPGLRIEDWTV